MVRIIKGEEKLLETNVNTCGLEAVDELGDEAVERPTNQQAPRNEDEPERARRGPRILAASRGQDG